MNFFSVLPIVAMMLTFWMASGCTKFGMQLPKEATLSNAAGKSLAKLSNLSTTLQTTTLEPGDTLAGAKLSLSPEPANGIEVQFVSEIGISNEGPHVELTGFRSVESIWVPVPQAPDKLYVLPDPSDFRSSPSATAAEIAEAAKAHGPEWVKLAEKCATPSSYPCEIKITKMRVRANSAAPFLEVLIPGGC